MTVKARMNTRNGEEWQKLVSVSRQSRGERWNSTNVVNSINIAEYYRVVSKVSPPSSALVQ